MTGPGSSTGSLADRSGSRERLQRLSGKPTNVGSGLDHLDLGTLGPRHKAKAERKHCALQQGRRDVGLGCSDRFPLLAGLAEKLQRPGTAGDEEQLADANLGVEVEFLTRAVKWAFDLDGEIRPAVPVRPAIFGRVTGKENR